MRTVNISDRVESEVGVNGWELPTVADDPSFESYKKVSDMDEAELAKAADLIDCPPNLLAAINAELDRIREHTHNDLADIWERTK